ISKLLRENSSAIPEFVTEHIRKIKSAVYSDLVDVSENFHAQISKLLSVQPDVKQNPNLLDRISKAADYFSTKVKSILVDDFSKADLEVDNRTLRKQLKNSSARLVEETELKLASLEICKTGFDVKQLLDSRAKTLIDNNKPIAKKQKAKDIINLDSIPHPQLYNILRTWRMEKASELEKPAFYIFSQKSLIELVNYLPVETATLKLINGLGGRKIEQFGADIIQIITKYCDENNVQRMEIPLKEITEKKPKIDTKKLSFELYQAGKTVAEIVKGRALTKNTIENHLAHYVKLGELDISRLISKEKLKKISDYFQKAESKSFGEAKAALDDDISYGELRMGLSYLENKE
ncbi:MAG: helix-turn-helix domain-containing protein, partial [Draconibacterium sp.]|nr:helix-turn-helix domain-containing protein [Draconibacterium sp.]